MTVELGEGRGPFPVTFTVTLSSRQLLERTAVSFSPGTSRHRARSQSRRGTGPRLTGRVPTPRRRRGLERHDPPPGVTGRGQIEHAVPPRGWCPSAPHAPGTVPLNAAGPPPTSSSRLRAGPPQAQYAPLGPADSAPRPIWAQEPTRAWNDQVPSPTYSRHDVHGGHAKQSRCNSRPRWLTLPARADA